MQFVATYILFSNVNSTVAARLIISLTTPILWMMHVLPPLTCLGLTLVCKD